MSRSTTAHGRTFNLCKNRRTMPVVGVDSADGVCDANPVASIQCCDVQITRKRNKLRGRSANPTITASPTRHKSHAVIAVAEGAGQDLLGAEATERDASGNFKLKDIGPFLCEKIKSYFKSETSRS